MEIESKGPPLVLGLGAVLFIMAVVHHALELTVIEWTFGPIAAVFLDGLPALVIVAAGYWLAQTDLRTENKWTVAVWSIFGSLGFVALMIATLLLQIVEGETFREPLFILLVSADIGGIGGFAAGYFYSRAEENADRAEQTSEALDFVNSIIRHDLRNDLNVIQGNAMKIKSDLEVDQSASVIDRKSQEAMSRIEDTRAIARTLSGEADLEAIDLTQLVSDTVSRFEEMEAVTISVDLPDAAKVMGDPGLRSVIDNLVENAVEHNDASNAEIEVVVEVRQETARLAVRDNGPGIPDDSKASMFAPRGDGPGNGGLHLVNTLVEGFDGSIWVEDNEPRGSVFIVELPLATGR